MLHWLRYVTIQSLLKKGKAHEIRQGKMAIVGAAMRKLIHIIYGVLKNGVPFHEKIA